MSVTETWSFFSGRPAQPWRVICDCQLHAARQRSILGHIRRAAGSLLHAARRHPAGVLLAFPLVLGGAGFTSFELHREVVDARYAAATVEQEAGVGEQELGLVTPLVRSAFANAKSIDELASFGVDPLLIERVREDYFSKHVPYGSLIYREARRNGLSPELVAAVAQAESDFRPGLMSPKNAQGLMQLLPSTAAFIGVSSDMTDPVENVRAGTRYLRYLSGRFGGDPVLILAAYNAGEGNVRRYGGIPPFPETREYLRRVNRAHSRFTRLVSERVEQAARAQALAEARMASRIRYE